MALHCRLIPFPPHLDTTSKHSSGFRIPPTADEELSKPQNSHQPARRETSLPFPRSYPEDSHQMAGKTGYRAVKPHKSSISESGPYRWRPRTRIRSEVLRGDTNGTRQATVPSPRRSSLPTSASGAPHLGESAVRTPLSRPDKSKTQIAGIHQRTTNISSDPSTSTSHPNNPPSIPDPSHRFSLNVSEDDIEPAIGKRKDRDADVPGASIEIARPVTRSIRSMVPRSILKSTTSMLDSVNGE